MRVLVRRGSEGEIVKIVARVVLFPERRRRNSNVQVRTDEEAPLKKTHGKPSTAGEKRRKASESLRQQVTLFE